MRHLLAAGGALGVKASSIVAVYVGEAAVLIGAGGAIAAAATLPASLLVAAGWHAFPPGALLGRRAE